MKNDFLMNTKEPQYSGNDNGEIVPDYYIDLNEQSRKEYDSNQPQFNTSRIVEKRYPNTPLNLNLNNYYNNNMRQNYPSNRPFNNYNEKLSFRNRNNSQIFNIGNRIKRERFDYSPLFQRQFIDTNSNNYIKTEPKRTSVLQKKITYDPYKIDKNHYFEIYYNPVGRRNYNVDFYTINRIKNERIDSPIIDQNIPMYPQIIRNNAFFDYGYDLNEQNQNDEKYDMNTKLALSHSIPNFRIFNYNAQDNSDYRRYSPYTNHYGESKNYFY